MFLGMVSCINTFINFSPKTKTTNPKKVSAQAIMLKYENYYNKMWSRNFVLPKRAQDV